jgi:hypothetical protein
MHPGKKLPLTPPPSVLRFLLSALPGSVGGYPPTPPQTPTSGLPAYGSSSDGFAANTECTIRAGGR